jgi:hypothetical protein
MVVGIILRRSVSMKAIYAFDYLIWVWNEFFACTNATFVEEGAA